MYPHWMDRTHHRNRRTYSKSRYWFQQQCAQCNLLCRPHITNINIKHMFHSRSKISRPLFSKWKDTDTNQDLTMAWTQIIFLALVMSLCLSALNCSLSGVCILHCNMVLGKLKHWSMRKINWRYFFSWSARGHYQIPTSWKDELS